MITLPGYEAVNKIYESVGTLVYRGRRDRDKLPVILKVLKDDYSSPAASAGYKHEYEITHSLDLEGAIKTYALEKHENTLTIIFEDIQGESLDKLMSGKSFSLEESLALAIKIVDALGGIHAADIIHKDINPSNIILNQATGRLKIIDFGISTILAREEPEIKSPDVLEGTLAYISPEQTGRMNRSLDYRADFYSLGVTFYEIICGKLPFESVDPLELVHSHIAREPEALHILNREIPEAVSNIVMKLLAKNAEDRYQSSRGIREDIKECLNRLSASGRIESFPVGRHDVPEKFHLFQRLYGREKEINILLGAFERVCKGERELLLVAGSSGIGKTSLIREIYRPVTLQKGYFVSGKFEQFKQDVPYGAVTGAMRELARQLLAESDEKIALWREKLLTALGPNGQIIIDMIPDMELIIGPQPTMPQLDPVEAQNRFNFVFQNFVRVFCRSEHPLVVFIDDLQWADSASLKLMELIMTDDRIGHLFLICACRSDEVTTGHPTMMALDELKRKGTSIEELILLPLSIENVTQLIADSLHTGRESATPLAELVTRKTGGNPFFIEAFLRSLYAGNLLEFNTLQGVWQWDMDRIEEMDITDNVAELLTEKIQRFANKTRQILSHASCMGGRFDLRILTDVSEESHGDVAASLREAVVEGLMLASGDIYWFSHDGIRQAAYSLISKRERQVVHQRVGKYLLQNTPANRLEERVFDIVNQLNLSIDIIDRRSDRDELARLNLTAGRRAKASAAYQPAFNYLQVGVELLGEDCWVRQYDLALVLHTEAAEAAYLCGEFDRMEGFVSVVLQQARTLLNKVKVYEIKIEAFKAQYKLSEAIKTGVSVLKLLGMKFPEKPNKLNILLDYMKTRFTLTGKRIEDLIDLREMDDPVKLAYIRIVESMGSATYFVIPELLPLIIFRFVRFSARYGNTNHAAFLYAVYGMILCGAVGDIESGHRFGQLALNLLERLDAREQKARTYHMVNAFVRHWKEHVRKTIEPLSEGIQSGLETGDFEYAGFCIFFHSFHLFVSGRELTVVEEDIERYGNTIGQLKHETSVYMHEINRQTVCNLMYQSEDPPSLVGEYYDECCMMSRHQEVGDRTTLFILYVSKLLLSYLFCEYPKAIENGSMAEKYIEGVIGFIGIPLLYFYDSLARLAVYSSSEKTEQRRILRKVSTGRKKMKKWARHAPMNHLHRFYLIEAERLRVLGKNVRAEDCYNRAIELAKEHLYVNDEALANELAAKFYLARGKTGIARAYMQEARHCYKKWGATAKVRDMDERYGRLLFSETQTLDSAMETGDYRSKGLDLASVMKASQAISSEITSDRLLDQLMEIVLENAGAQKGLLIMESGGRLLVEAEGTLDEEGVKILHSVPVEKKDNLSPAIVNYVARTREYLVLNDAALNGEFTNDPYIQTCRPKSILCAPIIHKSELTGIFYLENNLAAGAFTAERVEILRLLSSQIAISLENAGLYANLEESESRYRELYENIIDMVVFVGRNGKILMANPRFYETLDISRSDGTGLSLQKYIHPEDLSRVTKDMPERLMKEHEVKNFQFRIMDRHGKVLDVECNAKHIKRDDELTGFQMVIRDISERKRLEREILESNRNVQITRTATILGLAKLAEYRDKETGLHLERIRDYTKALAEELAGKPVYKGYITKKYIDDIYLSSILHDIGKVGIPDSILLKPDKLTPVEFEIVKRHSVLGGDILKTVESRIEGRSFLALGKEIAYYHHEKWDGTGYPEGLKGEKIPLSARIVALADVYDALTSERPYKEAYTHERARKIIINGRGRHFDPDVVDAFVAREDDFNIIREKMQDENEGQLLR